MPRKPAPLPIEQTLDLSEEIANIRRSIKLLERDYKSGAIPPLAYHNTFARYQRTLAFTIATHVRLHILSRSLNAPSPDQAHWAQLLASLNVLAGPAPGGEAAFVSTGEDYGS